MVHFYGPPIPLHWALLQLPTLSDRARLDDLILRTGVGLVPTEFLSRTFRGAYSAVFHFSIGERGIHCQQEQGLQLNRGQYLDYARSSLLWHLKTM